MVSVSGGSPRDVSGSSGFVSQTGCASRELDTVGRSLLSFNGLLGAYGGGKGLGSPGALKKGSNVISRATLTFKSTDDVKSRFSEVFDMDDYDVREGRIEGESQDAQGFKCSKDGDTGVGDAVDIHGFVSRWSACHDATKLPFA